MAELIWQWTAFDELGVNALYTLLALRQRVFVVEQDCAYLDADGLDDQAKHLLGWRDGELVAYLRALPAGSVHDDAPAIGRVVTVPGDRRNGLGTQLMQEGMRRVIEEWKPDAIRVSAQAHLESWYGTLGFEVSGPGYDEDGIPHLPMVWTRTS